MTIMVRRAIRRKIEEEHSTGTRWAKTVRDVALFSLCVVGIKYSDLNTTMRQLSEVRASSSKAVSNSAAHALTQAATHSSTAPQHTGPSDFQLAERESLGFFTDIPEREWNMLKERVKEVQPNMCSYCEGGDQSNSWFQNHFEPEFACRFEKRVGRLGDGGKWICDPHRYKEKKDCLIYSVGSHDDFSFEVEVKNVLGEHCEVHTFDPADYSRGAKKAGSIYHQWGISNVAGTSEKGEIMKTLRQTAEELGHIGRTIDIFKIDCEGCELDSWETWVDSSTVGVNLQQVLVEVHAIRNRMVQPATTNFFKGMHKHGYVIFHKEPNIHKFANGNMVEFAFLKLDPSFFEGMD